MRLDPGLKAETSLLESPDRVGRDPQAACFPQRFEQRSYLSGERATGS